MKEYITGYYCRDDLHLQIVNKDSNRKILQALNEAYPVGLNAYELARETKLPQKTVYAQKAELFREYYINHFETSDEESQRNLKKRGRPTAAQMHEIESKRGKTRLVIENASGIFDIFDGKKPTPLPPGKVIYSDGFVDVWDKIVEKEEEEELCMILLRLLEKILNRIDQHEDKNVRRWTPERDLEFCCSQCGLNHEARDFIRAILLVALDRIEEHQSFIELIRNNQFLTQRGYDHVKLKITQRRE